MQDPDARLAELVRNLAAHLQEWADAIAPPEPDSPNGPAAGEEKPAAENAAPMPARSGPPPHWLAHIEAARTAAPAAETITRGQEHEQSPASGRSAASTSAPITDHAAAETQEEAPSKADPSTGLPPRADRREQAEEAPDETVADKAAPERRAETDGAPPARDVQCMDTPEPAAPLPPAEQPFTAAQATPPSDPGPDRSCANPGEVDPEAAAIPPGQTDAPDEPAQARRPLEAPAPDSEAAAKMVAAQDVANPPSAWPGRIHRDAGSDPVTHGHAQQPATGHSPAIRRQTQLRLAPRAQPPDAGAQPGAQTATTPDDAQGTAADPHPPSRAQPAEPLPAPRPETWPDTAPPASWTRPAAPRIVDDHAPPARLPATHWPLLSDTTAESPDSPPAQPGADRWPALPDLPEPETPRAEQPHENVFDRRAADRRRRLEEEQRNHLWNVSPF